MKQLRVALGVIFGFWVLLGVGGALYLFVGEWNARRRLPPEMRTLEAIHKVYDDAVCLECSLGGGVLLVMGIVFDFGVLFIWMLIEVMHGVMKGRDGSRVRLNGSAPPNSGMGSVAGIAYRVYSALQLIHHSPGIILLKHPKYPFKWRHFEPTIILLCVR